MNQLIGDCRNSLAVVLPSLDPDAKFSGVVSGLVESGFRNIVIVDDGSDTEHQQWFAMAEEYPQCTVLHHGVNKGKGRALKTAFSYVLENIPDAEGVITIDGDGQHLLKDIIACGGGFSHSDQTSLERHLKPLLTDAEAYRRASQACLDYMNANLGSTEKILSTIEH